MYVLGLNVAANPSACLIAGDGRAVATSEQHQRGDAVRASCVPQRAITACLDALRVSLDQIDVVVVSGDDGADLARELPRLGRARVATIDPHLAHACSAFYPSGFERAAILVVDRQCRSASGYRAHGGSLERIFSIRDAADVPIAFEALNALLAIRRLGDDLASVMDLATRGRPEATPVTHADTAWAAGDLLQRVATDLAMQTLERTGARHLCVAGDAAVHGLAQIDPRRHSWFDQMYVPPAPGEAGTAVGAALYGWCDMLGAPPPCELETAFLGRAYGDAEVQSALAPYRAHHQTGPRRPEQVLDDVADLLAGGALVGWFDGGAGVGDPIGCRCVLASPRSVPLAHRLDAALGRPSFRALTAVVPAEDASDYFAISGSSPFAHRVARVVPQRTPEIPVVVRSDGTARIHTVDRWRAPRLDELLHRFRRRGGTPVLASAPLRQTGGPAIESPADALALWERTQLDAIFVQGELLVRSSERYSGDES